MFRKIVFTGGACGGKSSIIEALKNEIDCVISPEPAWIVFGLQQRLNIKINSYDRQHLIFNLHLLFEYWAEENAQKNKIILMDRSVIDNSVFTKNEQYKFLIDRYQIDQYKIFNNYSVIVYCESIAHSNPNEFLKLRPFADVDKTKEIDTMLVNAYKSCKRLLHNYESKLQNRINKCFNLLENLQISETSMHKLINNKSLKLLLEDSKKIMDKYNIAESVQNCILNPILKNQDYYLDNICNL